MKKGFLPIVSIFATLFLISFITDVNASPTYFNGCGLTNPPSNSYNILNGSVNVSTGTSQNCLELSNFNSNIIIDFDGNYIDYTCTGSNWVVGVYIANVHNVTVKNGTFITHNCAFEGIDIFGSYVTVENFNLIGDATSKASSIYYGIVVDSASSCITLNNVTETSNWYGLYFIYREVKK